MKPILFNTEMVRALLDGRKSVTRRVVKFRPGWNPKWSGYIPDGPVLYGDNNIPTVKAPYRPGDILYVRETWRKDVSRYMYKADYSDGEKFYQDGKEVSIKWHPSIHMPKEAARIFLRVTNVWVERMWDITDEQAVKEGFQPTIVAAWEIFHRAWDRTVKKSDLLLYGWDANPWVFVVEFERIDKAEAMKERQ